MVKLHLTANRAHIFLRFAAFEDWTLKSTLRQTSLPWRSSLILLSNKGLLIVCLIFLNSCFWSIKALVVAYIRRVLWLLFGAVQSSVLIQMVSLVVIFNLQSIHVKIRPVLQRRHSSWLIVPFKILVESLCVDSWLLKNWCSAIILNLLLLQSGCTLGNLFFSVFIIVIDVFQMHSCRFFQKPLPN